MGTLTPSDMKESLTSGLKFLRKVATISRGNTISCGIELFLRNKGYKTHLLTDEPQTKFPYYSKFANI